MSKGDQEDMSKHVTDPIRNRPRMYKEVRGDRKVGTGEAIRDSATKGESEYLRYRDRRGLPSVAQDRHRNLRNEGGKRTYSRRQTEL